MTARFDYLNDPVVKQMWDLTDAFQRLAERKFAAEIGNCPACGADPYFEFIEITAYPGGEPEFVPSGRARCSAKCWHDNPEAYIEAVGPDR